MLLRLVGEFRHVENPGVGLRVLRVQLVGSVHGGTEVVRVERVARQARRLAGELREHEDLAMRGSEQKYERREEDRLLVCERLNLFFEKVLNGLLREERLYEDRKQRLWEECGQRGEGWEEERIQLPEMRPAGLQDHRNCDASWHAES